MKCSNCGNEIADDSVFCECCGKKVAQVEQVSSSQQEMVSFGKAISTCFSKYATFSGRAQRSEYWWWCLFYMIVIRGVLFIDFLLGTAPILYYVVLLVFFLPYIAVAVRRCHDTNHSGWCFFCPFYNFVLMLLPSDTGNNEYGELNQ